MYCREGTGITSLFRPAEIFPASQNSLHFIGRSERSTSWKKCTISKKDAYMIPVSRLITLFPIKVNSSTQFEPCSKHDKAKRAQLLSIFKSDCFFRPKKAYVELIAPNGKAESWKFSSMRLEGRKEGCTLPSLSRDPRDKIQK